MNDELDAAYRHAIYRLHTAGGDLDLRVDEPAPRLDALLREHAVSSAAVITAWNPRSTLTDTGTNRAAQAALAAAAAQAGTATLPAVALDPAGHWPAEESLLILGVSAHAADALARRFQQNAWLQIRAGEAPQLRWVTGCGG